MKEKHTEANLVPFSRGDKAFFATMKSAERISFSGALYVAYYEGHIPNWSFFYTIVGLGLLTGMELIKIAAQENYNKESNANLN